MIYKKSFLFIPFVLIVLLFSCNSTKVQPTTNDVEVIEKPIKLSEQDQAFLNDVSTYKLAVIQVPKPANFGKKFSSSYILSVKKADGSNAVNFPITVEYPIDEKNGEPVLESQNLTTNESGRIIFSPEKTDFSINSLINFYPTPNSKNKKLIQAVKELGVSSVFNIKSRLQSNGAILFIYEFNEKGKPHTNNYTVLSALQLKGVNAGNAPISSENLIGASNEEIYTKNKQYVENHFGYLICGTIKFVSPVTQNQDKTWTCSLVSEIYILDMADGSEVYRNTFNYEATDAKYEKSISNAKKEIGKIITDNIFKSL